MHLLVVKAMSNVAKRIVPCPRFAVLFPGDQCCAMSLCAARLSISDNGCRAAKTCQISSRSFSKTAYCLINSFSGERSKATNDVSTPAQESSANRDEMSNVTVAENNEMSYEKFQHLAETNEMKAHLKYVLNEYKYMWHMGERVPTQLSEEEMKELLEKKSLHQRVKYLGYLRKTELTQLSLKKKKEARKMQKKAEWEEKKDKVDEYTYGIWHNTMFIRITNTYMNRFYAWRQANAILYGESIVIDFGYDHVMTKHECVNTADQILISYGYNKVSVDPFYLHFCNADESNPVLKAVKKAFPNKNGLVNITEKSYLDIFPKEKLVYLTPDARETLDVYDPDAVYIIGGFVDKSVAKPIALGKAKKEGLRCAKLPIDDYVVWKQGTKSLTVDQVFRIMLDLKYTKDWRKAFQHLPKRKVLCPDKSRLKSDLKQLFKRKHHRSERQGLLDMHADEL